MMAFSWCYSWSSAQGLQWLYSFLVVSCWIVRLIFEHPSSWGMRNFYYTKSSLWNTHSWTLSLDGPWKLKAQKFDGLGKRLSLCQCQLKSFFMIIILCLFSIYGLKHMPWLLGEDFIEFFLLWISLGTGIRIRMETSFAHLRLVTQRTNKEKDSISQLKKVHIKLQLLRSYW